MVVVNNTHSKDKPTEKLLFAMAKPKVSRSFSTKILLQFFHTKTFIVQRLSSRWENKQPQVQILACLIFLKPWFLHLKKWYNAIFFFFCLKNELNEGIVFSLVPIIQEVQNKWPWYKLLLSSTLYALSYLLGVIHFMDSLVGRLRFYN